MWCTKSHSAGVGRGWNRPETNKQCFSLKGSQSGKYACLSPLDTMVSMTAITFCVLKDIPGFLSCSVDFVSRDTSQLPGFLSIISRIFYIIYFITILRGDYAFLLSIANQAKFLNSEFSSHNLILCLCKRDLPLFMFSYGFGVMQSVHTRCIQLPLTWLMGCLVSDPQVLCLLVPRSLQRANLLHHQEGKLSDPQTWQYSSI